MKRMFVLMLLAVCTIPLLAEVSIGAKIEGNYFMETSNDDAVEPESYFGIVSSKLTAKGEWDEGLSGYIKLNLVEKMSDGIDTKFDTANSYVYIEELWSQKTGAFGQDALSIKFGKMEVPFNLDYDKSITHSFTNGKTLNSSGVGEIDNTWGLNVGYGLGEGLGTINLTTFEGMGGTDSTDDNKDEDTGLFNSMVLQWDTGKKVDAFGVAGLRVIVAYAMLAQDEDADDGTIISLGSTYTLKDMGLTFGLEVDMSTDVVNGEDGAMLMAFDIDYAVNEQAYVGLTYESMTFTDNDTLGTDNRMSLRAGYEVADKYEVRLEYASTDNTEDDDDGGTLIALGFVGKL